MSESNGYAPGWPGIAPRSTSSAKSGVGTAVGRSGRVWFTVSHGILNKIYFPRLDAASTRDSGLLVSDGLSFFSEEKRDCRFEVTPVEFGIPAFHLINREKNGTYQIEKEIFADPHRTVVLQKIRFRESGKPRSTPAPSSPPYQVYALVAPYLGNSGFNNTAWGAVTRACPCCLPKFPPDSPVPLPVPYPGKQWTVGFAGCSDGWQELSHNYQLNQVYQRAEDGNVALSGEVVAFYR